ncbi:MAG: SDR family oxidoreductase [Candidatus Liptonbacteria bacterium]|nr:SDR family oxidoreductase [Candidatus Liptonbacteria bacterium]
MSKKTILVTGALGHIGSKLIRELSPKLVGRVVILDNLLTQRYSSLFDLPSDIKYEFHEDDIRTADFAKYLKEVDAVIHLAAITDAPSSKDKPEETFDVNLGGTKRLADACLAAKVPLLFPSTTSVYGSQADLVDETSTELKPQSPYADSKIQAEEYLRGQKSNGLRFVICRFGTIFGYSIGMRFHTAVNKFTWQAVNGTPLTVWKTAWKQKRPYLDLADCVKAISLILEKDLFDGEIYNILTSNFTVENIVTAIKKFVPDLAVSYVDSAIMNQLSYEVSDAKFRALGFVPSGDLEKGIEATVHKLRAVRTS